MPRNHIFAWHSPVICSFLSLSSQPMEGFMMTSPGRPHVQYSPTSRQPAPSTTIPAPLMCSSKANERRVKVMDWIGVAAWRSRPIPKEVRDVTQQSLPVRGYGPATRNAGEKKRIPSLWAEPSLDREADGRTDGAEPLNETKHLVSRTRSGGSTTCVM